MDAFCGDLDSSAINAVPNPAPEAELHLELTQNPHQVISLGQNQQQPAKISNDDSGMGSSRATESGGIQTTGEGSSSGQKMMWGETAETCFNSIPAGRDPGSPNWDDLGLASHVGSSDSATNQTLEAQKERLDECSGGNFKFWSNLYHNSSNKNEKQPPSPSRLDTEWGYVLEKKKTNKRKMDVKSSGTGVSSCSDVSEALSAISAALSLSSSSSSSSSGDKDNQMISDCLANSEVEAIMQTSEVTGLHYVAPSNPCPYSAYFSMIQDNRSAFQFNSTYNSQIPPQVQKFSLQSSSLSNNSTSDETDEQQLSLINERRKRRMISNIESAIRSHMRKKKHLDELRSQVVWLRNENQQLIEKLNHVSECHHRIVRENAQLKEEASELQQMVSDMQLNNPYETFRDLLQVMLNPPTQSLSHSSEDNRNHIQAALHYGEKGRTNEANSVAPVVGMEFLSEEEIYEFYKTYAESTGFRVRKGKVHRSQSDNSIRKRYIFCSREGRKENKPTTYKKKDTRTGCNARIECKPENGKWKICRVFDHHNHPLERANGSEIHAANGEGKISTEAVKKSVEFDEFKMLAHDEKAQDLNPEEVQLLIRYLENLQEGDSSFFSAVRYDDDGKAKAVFWMDWSSRIDYKYFGDVLILDTTSKMDNYGVICAPFMGLNHHRQYVLFGCAFLLDETINSLVWLLQSFVKAMDSVQPKTVLTNESLTMANAIKEVLPKTKHQIGFWFIRQNIASCSTRFVNPDFQSFIERCCFKCQTEEEFRSWWFQLLETFDIRDNARLGGLYRSREKWAPVFNKKTFIGGIRDTTGIDGIFQRLTKEAKTLPMFVTEFLTLAVQQRKQEALADFLCKGKEQEIVLENNSLEQQAADIYTHTMFKMFQKELIESLQLRIEIIHSSETAAKYVLEDDRRNYIVEFNCLDSTAICSCNKYESVGILCCHILKVFGKMTVFNIPRRYILKRWTKFAKEDHMVLNYMM